MEATKLVGCAVGLVRDGKVVFLKGYGLADRDRKLPVTTETMFRWASISKPVTAYAALQLWENKRLDLDADVRQYVPEFPDHGVKITLRDLLCHQSGIVHYTNGKVVRTQRDYDRPNPFEDVVLALDTFKESPLLFKPRERFSYSTHGYILASAVVERAGGKKFADQVTDRIARPLGMKSFQPDYQWKEIPHRAVGYRDLLGNRLRSPDADVSWKLGGGGFISNVEDLARFCAGIVQGELVNRETERLMWTPVQPADGQPSRYGLGLRIIGEGPSRLVEHSGAQEKTRTMLIGWPEQKAGAVFMTNSEFVQPSRVTLKLLRAAAPELQTSSLE